LSDFTIDRSATDEMAVDAVSVLLAETGSAVVAAMVAVLESDPPVAVTVVVTVMFGAVVTFKDPRVQVTTPAAWPQLHPVPVAEPKATPPGSVSVTVSPDAASGPWLTTESV